MVIQPHHLQSQNNDSPNLDLLHLFKDKDNRSLIMTGFISTIVIWLVFKFYFPNPFFAYDSYQYLQDALANKNVSFRPIGYSKVIRLISQITHSPYILVTIQYIALQIGVLYLVLVMRKVFSLNKNIGYLLLIIMSLNPLFIVASNFLLSDILFTSISIFWIIQLIRIIYDAPKSALIIQPILLLLIFTFRYNAIYFPIISTVIILFSTYNLRWKIISLFIQYTFLLSFILYTCSLTKKETGVYLFSPMSNWKIANDALYMYENIYKQENNIPGKFSELDSLVRDFYSSPIKEVARKDNESDGGVFYIFFLYSPLKQYLYEKFGSPIDFKKFSSVAPLYKDYGRYLITKNYAPYFKYIVYPNFCKYWSPNAEIFDTKSLAAYNPSPDQDNEIINKLMRLKVNPEQPGQTHQFLNILYHQTKLFGLCQVLFILSLLGFIVLNGLKSIGKKPAGIILFIIIFWIIDIIFGTLTGPIVTRYQFFIFIIEVFFITYFINYIYYNSKNTTS